MQRRPGEVERLGLRPQVQKPEHQSARQKPGAMALRTVDVGDTKNMLQLSVNQRPYHGDQEREHTETCAGKRAIARFVGVRGLLEITNILGVALNAGRVHCIGHTRKRG
jgi:hypothetical protein